MGYNERYDDGKRKNKNIFEEFESSGFTIITKKIIKFSFKFKIKKILELIFMFVYYIDNFNLVIDDVYYNNNNDDDDEDGKMKKRTTKKT